MKADRGYRDHVKAMNDLRLTLRQLVLKVHVIFDGWFVCMIILLPFLFFKNIFALFVVLLFLLSGK